MKNKTTIFSFLLILSVMAAPFGVSASNEQVMKKEYTYESKDKDEKQDAHFKNKLNENGKEWELATINYEIVSDKVITKEETVTKEIKSKEIKKDEEYVPEEAINEDGVEYSLKTTDKKEVEIVSEYKQTVKGYEDYSDKSNADNAPDKKEIEATNKKTGKVVKCNCDKTTTEILYKAGWQDASIDITFISYDSNIFEWNGVQIEKNVKEPLKGYEDVLLRSIGADSDRYRIKDIYWKGKAYKNKAGILCRDCVADVSRNIDYYRVNYQGEIIVPAEKGYVYTSTYEAVQSVPTGEHEYQIKAIAIYKEVIKDENNFPIVGGIVALALAIALAVGIIFIIKKKRK
jgi:hypothetical protein